MENKIKTVVVTGPTATGKTSLGVKLARAYRGEVISVDSRQVFRGMDIGTGKDLSDFGAGENSVPYHLMDIVDPNDDYNLLTFCEDASRALVDISQRNSLPVMVGGTAMYLNAILNGYTLPGGPPDLKMRDELRSKPVAEVAALLKQQYPEAYETIKDKGNMNRLMRAFEKVGNQDKIADPISSKIDPLVLGVFYHRKDVHRRIEMRLDQRIEEGMVDEVQGLYDSGVSWERLDYFGLEYRYVAKYLKGEMSLKAMRDELLIKIRQFAKRQDIWFRKMEREGLNIHWIEKGDFEKAKVLVDSFLAGEKLAEPEIRIKDVYYGKKSS